MIEPILPAVVDRLRSIGTLEAATVEDVTIGDAAVMVEVGGVAARSGAKARAATGSEATRGSQPTAGLAHRPSGPTRPEDDLDIDTLVGWATRTSRESSIDGQDRHGGAGDGATSADGLLENALGVAAINALSAPYIDWQTGDPMALLDPSVDTIATVGLFRPAFRKFDDVDVRVIERTDVGSVTAPAGVRVATFQPDAASAAMAGADVVFVTGSTFVYGGLERYLAAAPAAATVVLIGATASVLPDPVFDAGVDVVAGASVADRARVREAVASGACGTDLHDAGVRKVYVAADRSTDPSQGLTHTRSGGSNRDETTDD
ncbi:Rossmann-like domain-containing protein [Natrinema ejinorense]|uniref:Putative heavy-metal chelation domain-containing protein n=1 Tax=Natrinema ejinorense TaxID=373386 RepID=A0A2A5QUZ3_9EURY|nr:DUF364 domain-containing protein [Natrinema ejinorense]PCR90666.1 hypothetical protein CP557_09175 [Natrinema ejinorense]